MLLVKALVLLFFGGVFCGADGLYQRWHRKQQKKEAVGK